MTKNNQHRSLALIKSQKEKKQTQSHAYIHQQ